MTMYFQQSAPAGAVYLKPEHSSESLGKRRRSTKSPSRRKRRKHGKKNQESDIQSSNSSTNLDANSSPEINYSAFSQQTERTYMSDNSSGSLDSDGFIKRKQRETDDTYRDDGSPDEDFEIEAQFDRDHPTTVGQERRNLVVELTQEKARRMAQAVKVPQDARMGEGEKNLYLELALRGCKPVMFHHWKTDFSTLPDSLFAYETPPADPDEIIFKTITRSEFHAIKAIKELLDLGGQVRDCNYLSVYPPQVIQKAIAKYARWAIDDAGLRTTSDTLDFHIICVQKRTQSTFATVTKLVKKLTKLAIKHRSTYGNMEDPYWPTLVGYVICGPIATILSLDSDPRSPAWQGPADSRVKYMGQFDLTEPDQDVWNSLALAISVVHVRETMLKLASTYSGPRAPLIRGQNTKYSDDDD